MEEHPAGLGVMQFCGCSSHVERSEVFIWKALGVPLTHCYILMKSPVLEKNPTQS